MKRTEYHIIIILLILCLAEAKASNKTDIYNCYITGNMAKWKLIIDKMASEKRSDPAVILELVNYQYGYIGWAIGDKKIDEAKQYLKLAEENLDELGKYPSYNSIINAYKAAFYGFKIGMNKLLAPFIGNKSLDCARIAVSQNESNYLAWIQLGNAEFYKPKTLGGSKAEAIIFFTKAQQLMESNQAELKENWNYLSLLTVIAQSYSYTGDYAKSKQYLDKILKIEPDFAWVKNDLYKQIYDKMKN